MKGYKGCPRCRGKGYVLVQGGQPDERIPEVCPDCEARQIADHEDVQHGRQVEADQREERAVAAWRSR